jgi:protocatechuate 3,4-dioxygenase beta subunit
MTEAHAHDDIFDQGLSFDLVRLLDRRRALQLFGIAGLATLTACGGSSSATSAGSASPSAAAATTAASAIATAAVPVAASCDTIPDETAGPYPGDGSNGPDVLTQSGIVRQDIRQSFGAASGTAQGVPLTINLIVQNAKSCSPIAGAAVYVWHCSRDGLYSLYSPGATGENYLRGVQQADASGRLSFRSIYPGAYPGRWPHVHFEVYPTLAAATSAGSKLATSQIALPEAACKAVYATTGYGDSSSNLAQTPLSSDMVFSDGATQQTPTITGSPSTGYSIELVVPV